MACKTNQNLDETQGIRLHKKLKRSSGLDDAEDQLGQLADPSDGRADSVACLARRGDLSRLLACEIQCRLQRCVEPICKLARLVPHAGRP